MSIDIGRLLDEASVDYYVEHGSILVLTPSLFYRGVEYTVLFSQVEGRKGVSVQYSIQREGFALVPAIGEFVRVVRWRLHLLSKHLVFWYHTSTNACIVGTTFPADSSELIEALHEITYAIDIVLPLCDHVSQKGMWSEQLVALAATNPHDPEEGIAWA